MPEQSESSVSRRDAAAMTPRLRALSLAARNGTRIDPAAPLSRVVAGLHGSDHAPLPISETRARAGIPSAGRQHGQWIDKFHEKVHAPAPQDAQPVAASGAAAEFATDRIAHPAPGGATATASGPTTELTNALPAQPATDRTTQRAADGMREHAAAHAAQLAAETSVDLTIEALATPVARMPAPLYARMRETPPAPVLPTALVLECWEALEHNTRLLSSAWPLIVPQQPAADGLIDAADDTADAAVVQPRFWDILPVRATAVRDTLRSQRLSRDCFLHANWLDLGTGRQLIVSQKPLPGEVAGFQHMLLEREVGVIVDLTRYAERELHAAYAPEQQASSLAIPESAWMITCERRSKLKDLRAIEQALTIDDGSQVHQLTRLHFPNWPDHGTIESATLCALADKIDSLDTDPTRAMLIHCRAGVGRTGTLTSFMAARRLLQAALRDGSPAVFGAPSIDARTRALGAVRSGSADAPGISRRACTPELILRTVLEVVARGRVCRGPGFVQVEQQFCLIVQTLAQIFMPAPDSAVLVATPTMRIDTEGTDPGRAIDAPDVVPAEAAPAGWAGYTLPQVVRGRLLYLWQKVRLLLRGPRA